MSDTRKAGELALAYMERTQPRHIVGPDSALEDLRALLAERDAAQARAERAEAEVARLRAALERIADTESPALEWPRRHAKAALAAQVSK